MLRALLIATAAVVAVWGTALRAAPVTVADPPDIDCTQVSNDTSSCVYKNCTDAKAHGRCNITEDDPAYCPKQDRDGDGLACEC
jgi:excalibur calcium-binding domain-containing protein